MRYALFCAIPLLMSGFASAQSADLNLKKPLFIQDIHVSGTRSLDSTQLNEIVGPLNQLKVSGTEEIRERLRFQFQEHGYFDAKVKSITVKPIDPLAMPRPVDVEAEISEGPCFIFYDIVFTGVRAFTADELRAKFPIRPADQFSRGKVASGLEALRNAYGKLGYLDMYAIPDVTKLGNAMVDLKIDVRQGEQYRMGTLEFGGNSDVAEQLRPRWKLEAGAPYDASYLKTFFQENESLFPPLFDLSKSTKLARNCRDKTVTVFVELGPNHPSVPVPNDVGCDKEPNKTTQSQ